VKHRCVLFSKDCISKLSLKDNFKPYFIKYYSPIFKRFILKLYFYYFMQAKPLGLTKVFYSKPGFGSENIFLIGLKPCCDFYKIYENGLV
jgi:hypothetical protein